MNKPLKSDEQANLLGKVNINLVNLVSCFSKIIYTISNLKMPTT